MKMKKKIPEERQIALILKDLDENYLKQMKQVIIGMIILMNKCGEKPLLINFPNNSRMN